MYAISGNYLLHFDTFSAPSLFYTLKQIFEILNQKITKDWICFEVLLQEL